MKDEKDYIDSREGATLGDYLELMRLPNVFTAMAGAALGFLFVREPITATDAWLLVFLLASSSLLYVAGVVLNDVFDMELDAQQRPDRPLPSGRISLRRAWWFGWQLLFAGAGLGWIAAFIMGNIMPGAIVIMLVTCILIYDAGLKSTVMGPILMAPAACSTCFWG